MAGNRNTISFGGWDEEDEDDDRTAQVQVKLKPPRARPTRAHVLQLKKGQGAAPRIELKAETLVLGRATECEIPVDSGQVSRQHVRFTRIDDEYQVEDLESRNGVYLNGLKVHLAVLREGDELQVGNLVFLYQEGT